MKRPVWWRTAAAASALALTLAACGDGDDEPDATDTPDAEETEEPEGEETEDPLADVEVVGWGDGQLTLGRVMAETGFLDYLGGPPIAGTQLAVEEINEAGGVLGQDVALLEFDSGTDPSVAVPNVGAALSEGADVILGAMASGVTQSFIQTLDREGIYACSSSATSPEFNDQATASTFFRMAPPDEAQATVMADTVIADGNTGNVAIAARSDDYGVNLAQLVQEEVEAVGGTVMEPVIYTDETTFDAEADQIVSADPSAVVIIGFREGGELIGKLVDGGLDPATFYGSDGVFSSQLPGIVGGSDDVIDGMTVFGASGTEDFNARLADAGVNDFLYGAQGYDCAMLMALWAVAEDTDDVREWDPETLRGLTADGTECTGFEECSGLLADGEDIDYFGATGQFELTEGNPGGEGNLGNPSFTTYGIAEYQDGGVLTTVDTSDVSLE